MLFEASDIQLEYCLDMVREGNFLDSLMRRELAE